MGRRGENEPLFGLWHGGNVTGTRGDDRRLREDEWTTVRGFVDGDDGYTWPEYEAKFVTDPPMRYVEDRIVLVREVSSYGGRGRVYHLPVEVVEAVARRLPGATSA